MGNGAGAAAHSNDRFEILSQATTTSRSGTLSPKTSNKTVGMRASGSSTQDAASGLIGVANSCLETKHNTAVEAIEELVSVASLECGGEAYFYSVPEGRGRLGVRFGSNLLGRPSSGFILVCTSGVLPQDAECEEAPPEHLAALRRAMEPGREVAVVGDYAAAVVRTDYGLEGLLLAHKPPRIHSSSAPPLTLAVRLWASVLSERLSKVHWRQEAKETEQALESFLTAMEHMVSNDIDQLEETAAMMVPRQLASSVVQSERVALWTLDPAAQELVLNNSGHFDGNRLPVKGTLVGDAIQDKEGRVLLAAEPDPIPGRRDESQTLPSRTSLCVPITQANPEIAMEEDDGFASDDSDAEVNDEEMQTALSSSKRVELETSKIQAVLQFKRKPDADGVIKPVAHFDLVCAEALQRSVLPIVLSARDCFMRFLATKRQRVNVQNVTQRLSRAGSVTEMARLIEQEVAEALHCETCSLWFVDDDREEVWALPTDTLPRGIRLKIGEGIVGNMAARAKETGADEVDVVNDPQSCPLWKGDQTEGFVTRNIMTAPVWSGGGTQRRLIALIQILNKCTSFGGIQLHETIVAFTQTDVQLLQRLAQAVGEHLRQLLLDIMWTKTRMDSDRDGRYEEQSPEIVQEYYSREFARQNHGSIRTVVRGTSLRVGHGPPPGMHSSNSMKSYRIGRISEDEAFTGEGGEDVSAALDGWSLDYWSLRRPDSFRFVLRALRTFNVFEELAVDTHVFYRFFRAIEQNYRNVPYHNFFHALSTVHYVYKLVCAGGLEEHLTRVDLFALVMAALCHDCDHRGRNTAFEVQTRSELALRYNDSSPLENHHCARAFEIALWTGGCDIFDGLTSEQYSVTRGRIIAGILSTDMKCHGHHVELVQSFELRPGDHNAQGQFLVELFLHTADIGNPLMPSAISERWGKALADEFAAQVEAEESLGLPVTTFMQGLHRPNIFAKSQLSFIDLVLAPLVSPLCRTFEGLAEVKEFMEQNRAKHAKVVEASR